MLSPSAAPYPVGHVVAARGHRLCAAATLHAWRRCTAPAAGWPATRPATPTRCCSARPSTTASPPRSPARSATPKNDLVNLQFVFGDQLGQYSGRIKQANELEEMAHEFGEFKVVVVEVCQSCRWNHMILSYLLGDGGSASRPSPADRRGHLWLIPVGGRSKTPPEHCSAPQGQGPPPGPAAACRLHPGSPGSASRWVP